MQKKGEIKDPEMNASSRQQSLSPMARAVLRGTSRLLVAHGLSCIAELTLPNTRRADLVGISKDGEISIVEVKSSLADFRSDNKWHEYRDYCDKLYFAVSPEFPVDVLPETTGLILADNYWGEIVRQAPIEKLATARRKTMIIRFGRTAATRLSAIEEPGGTNEAPADDSGSTNTI